MQNQCNVVRDLIPLMLDRVASDESMKLISDHISGCEECRRHYDAMKAALPEVLQPDLEDDPRGFAETIKVVKNKRIRRRILSLCLTLVVCLTGTFGGFCVAYQLQSGYIHTRYAGITKTSAVSGIVNHSDELTCEVLETAVVGDQLLQVMQIRANEENVFLYPLNAFPSAVFPVTAGKALSLVIGEQFFVENMPEDAQGKTVKAYTDEHGMNVVFVDVVAMLANSTQFSSRNKWEMKEDGSLLVYTWIGPINDEPEQATTISCTAYTENLLNECASARKRAAPCIRFQVAWTVIPEAINTPETFRAASPVSWESKDGGVHMEVSSALLEVYPEFCTIEVELTVTGDVSADKIALGVIPGNATDLKMTDFTWTEKDGVLTGYLYGTNLLSTGSGKLQVQGTIMGEWVGLTIPLQ